MMQTEWSISNIFKRIKTKINNDTPIVLYHPTYTIFDNIIKHALNNYILLEDASAKTFFSFDFTIHNSVFIQAKDIIDVHNTHTPLIIFNHSDISDIKTEDRIILNNNLTNVHVINFDTKSNHIIDNSLNINYPIPDPTNTDNIVRDKKLLIINTSNNPVIKNIFNSIQSSNISADMVNKLDNDVQNVYKLFARYNTIMDLSNRLHLLLADRVGCNIIANKNLSGYKECDDYIFFEPNQNLYQTIHKALSKKTNNKADNNESNQFQEYFRKHICM